MDCCVFNDLKQLSLMNKFLRLFEKVRRCRFFLRKDTLEKLKACLFGTISIF